MLDVFLVVSINVIAQPSSFQEHQKRCGCCEVDNKATDSYNHSVQCASKPFTIEGFDGPHQMIGKDYDEDHYSTRKKRGLGRSRLRNAWLPILVFYLSHFDLVLEYR